MSAEKPSKRHELLMAVRILKGVVDFSKQRFDFSTPRGQVMLQEGDAACKILEEEIERLYPKKETVNISN